MQFQNNKENRTGIAVFGMIEMLVNYQDDISCYQELVTNKLQCHLKQHESKLKNNALLSLYIHVVTKIYSMHPPSAAISQNSTNHYHEQHTACRIRKQRPTQCLVDVGHCAFCDHQQSVILKLCNPMAMQLPDYGRELVLGAILGGDKYVRISHGAKTFGS